MIGTGLFSLLDIGTSLLLWFAALWMRFTVRLGPVTMPLRTACPLRAFYFPRGCHAVCWCKPFCWDVPAPAPHTPPLHMALPCHYLPSFGCLTGFTLPPIMGTLLHGTRRDSALPPIPALWFPAPILDSPCHLAAFHAGLLPLQFPSHDVYTPAPTPNTSFCLVPYFPTPGLFHTRQGRSQAQRRFQQYP